MRRTSLLATGVFFLVLWAAGMLCSCVSSSAELKMDARWWSYRELILKSDVILLARVDRKVMLDQSATSERGVVARLGEITLKAICVVKGKDIGASVSFRMFVVDPAVPQNGDFERLRVGDQGLFFLRNEGNRLRGATDVYSSVIPYYGTPPESYHRSDKYSDNESVCRLLLGARNRKNDNGETMHDIAKSLPLALSVCGYRTTNRIFSEEAAEASEEIKIETCLLGYEQLFWSRQCVDRFLNKNVLTPSHKDRIKVARARRDYLRRISEDATIPGGRCPLTEYSTGLRTKDMDDYVEFYDYLATSADDVIRKCAKAELARIARMKSGKTE